MSAPPAEPFLPRPTSPDLARAEDLARDLLESEGTRLAHVLRAGSVAATLGCLFDQDEAGLLVAAATLHDIGYSSRVARTGFHPLDGALYLRDAGYPERLAALVAHHSLAIMTAPDYGIHDLAEQFPREESLVADALTFADMHSAPDGRLIHVEQRLIDISRRHAEPAQLARSHHLRAALGRVGHALAALPAAGPTRTVGHGPDARMSTTA